jgi:hypothetical protein
MDDWLTLERMNRIVLSGKVISITACLLVIFAEEIRALIYG